MSKKKKKKIQSLSTEIYLSELKLTVVTGGARLTNMDVSLKIEPLPVSLYNIMADDGKWVCFCGGA